MIDIHLERFIRKKYQCTSIFFENYEAIIILFLMEEFLSIHVTFITLLDSLILCLLRMKRLSRRERTNPLIDV